MVEKLKNEILGHKFSHIFHGKHDRRFWHLGFSQVGLGDIKDSVVASCMAGRLGQKAAYPKCVTFLNSAVSGREKPEVIYYS